MNSFKENDKTNSRERQVHSELLNIQAILRKLSIFNNVPQEIISLYALIAERVFYQERAFLYRQGDRARRAYLILSGEAQMYLDHKGKIFTVQELGAMDFFGEMGLLADFERVFSVQAVTPLEVLQLEREGFKKIMEQYPTVGIQVLERIIQSRMKRVQKNMYRRVEAQEDETLMIIYEDSIGM